MEFQVLGSVIDWNQYLFKIIEINTTKITINFDHHGTSYYLFNNQWEETVVELDLCSCKVFTFPNCIWNSFLLVLCLECLLSLKSFISTKFICDRNPRENLLIPYSKRLFQSTTCYRLELAWYWYLSLALWLQCVSIFHGWGLWT